MTLRHWDSSHDTGTHTHSGYSCRGDASHTPLNRPHTLTLTRLVRTRSHSHTWHHEKYKNWVDEADDAREATGFGAASDSRKYSIGAAWVFISRIMDPRIKWWVSLFWHRINDTLTPENGDTESDWSVHLDEEQCTSKQAYFFRAGENFVAILPISPVSVYSLWLSVSVMMQAHWL